MSEEILVNGVVMEKMIDGVEYARCFHCGKFFTPTIIDMELQLFCSDECEKDHNKMWGEFWAKDNDTKDRIE